jgi:NAD(P)-dependent dehydrogenase (short-subunit alcohol dehydrogenase family)
MDREITGAPTRVALVTGSGKKRIGWHVAEALRRSGYALALHYHRYRAEALETLTDFKNQSVDAVAYQASCPEPDDAVSFLINDEFVTGVCLPVDGGRTIYSPADR